MTIDQLKRMLIEEIRAAWERAKQREEARAAVADPDPELRQFLDDCAAAANEGYHGTDE